MTVYERGGEMLLIRSIDESGCGPWRPVLASNDDTGQVRGVNAWL